MAEAGITKGGPIPLWPTRCYPLLYKTRSPLQSCLRIKLTKVFDVPWIRERDSSFRSKANASRSAYFCYLEGSFPTGGEFVEPPSV
jgi:hypothetical protein